MLGKSPLIAHYSTYRELSPFHAVDGFYPNIAYSAISDKHIRLHSIVANLAWSFEQLDLHFN